jgi:hypothetical protein
MTKDTEPTSERFVRIYHKNNAAGCCEFLVVDLQARDVITECFAAADAEAIAEALNNQDVPQRVKAQFSSLKELSGL